MREKEESAEVKKKKMEEKVKGKGGERLVGEGRRES